MSDDDLQRTARIDHSGQAAASEANDAGDAKDAGDVYNAEDANGAPQIRSAPRRRVVAALGGATLVAGVSVTAGIVAATRGSGGATTTAGAVPAARRSAEGSPSPSWTPSQHPTTDVATRPQYYVDNAGPKAIALTMDDGPHPVYTPQVLEILREHDIKATFNMIGRQVGENLSIVREVSAAGHTITNHTWNHADLTRATYAQVLSQMDRCNDALAEAQQSPSIFRAPYGNWSKAVFEACAARGLKPVDWSVDPRDWDTAHVDAQDIVRTVLRTTRAHDIILEHDGGGVRRNTVAAMRIFIPKLLAAGFVFVAM